MERGLDVGATEMKMPGTLTTDGKWGLVRGVEWFADSSAKGVFFTKDYTDILDFTDGPGRIRGAMLATRFTSSCILVVTRRRWCYTGGMLPPMNEVEMERARVLLCELGDFVRDAVVAGRHDRRTEELASVSRESVADTIYSIDTLSEEAITEWFLAHWPSAWPVELVAEGFDDPAMRLFPRGVRLEETRFRCVVDPIDGTRGLMYDKRPAWVLAGLAPQRGAETRLPDVFLAAMTEIPLRKQWRADQISAVRGRGLVIEGVDVRNRTREPVTLRASQARDFRHGFASIAKFFPAGKVAAARLEVELWQALYGEMDWPVIFDDQYISTGGQFYELLSGHDRMNGDLRPMILARENLGMSLVCHPYDVCTAMLLAEAGIIFEKPDGGIVEVPLDLTSPVAWMAYANEGLAELARPIVRRLVRDLDVS
jgi:hypothetical protein